MTQAIEKQKMEWSSLLKVVKTTAFVLTALLLVLAILLFIKHLSMPNIKVEAEQIQSEFIQTLTERQGEYDERSIVLSGTTLSTAKSLAERMGAELRITSDGSFATLTLPEGKTFLEIAQSEEYLYDLKKMSIDFEARISDFEEEYQGERLPSRPNYTVSDSAFSEQTYLDYINMQNVWSTTKGNGVTVAVIDTGIDTDHPEFAGRISEYSYNASEDKIVKDFVLEDGSYDWSLIEDEQGHGTSVAGVIGASMNSGEIVGIAPEVALIVIKAECSPSGAFKRTSDLVFGLYYAIERDVHVVNMSFGSFDPENPFAEPAQLAYDSDILCFAAAGNEATASLCYPAADENVIGVGALAEDSWELATYSNYGENVDLVAPGTTYTAKMGGGYATTNGTSLACPVAVGAASLFRSLSSYRYSETKVMLENLYASCADLGDLGPDWYFGYGAIDVSAWVLEARGTVTFDMRTDELDNTEQLFIRNHTLQDMPEPERLYAVFDGWYYDPQCTEEYNWYADVFTTDLTLYANWVNEEDGIPYTYVELDDGTIEIRSYTGHRRYITIPDYIDGKVVSSIGEGAFAGETRLRQINLPKYLVRIRDRAFSGCSNLVGMSIPQGVTSIGAEAFYDNIRLSTLVFEGETKIQHIGELAFSGCSKMRSFTVPKSLTDLAESAFYRNTNMQSFAVEKGNTAYSAIDGMLCNVTGSRLIAYPYGRTGKIVIPASVKTIGAYGFCYGKLSEVEFSNTQVLEDGAFAYSSLTALALPDTLTSLGAYAFTNNIQLASLSLGNTLTEVPEGAFKGCISLQSVTFGAQIETIGEKAFSECSWLSEITFAENSCLKEFGKEAFYRAPLTSITFPESLTIIKESAFSYNYFTTLVFPDSLLYIGPEAFCQDPVSPTLKSIYFSENSTLQAIGTKAFFDALFTSVSLPSQVLSIDAAFAGCFLLNEVSVSEQNPYYNDFDGIVYTEDNSALVCYPAGKTDTEYTIHSAVTEIKNCAFFGAGNLRNIVLPEGLTKVGQYAFELTSSIQTMKIPSSLTVLTEQSFYRCGARQYILPETLVAIEEQAMAENTNLTSLAIPDNVTRIGSRAFMNDMALSSIIFGENSKMVRFGFESFYGCGITSFRVPKNVSTMSQGVFAGCFKLTRLTFAKNSKLTSISGYMFDGCRNLRSIVFEEGSALTSIQAHGLEGMTKLISIDFGNAQITNIDNFAFRFCESLTSFTVPDGVTNLGRFAFYYCDSLSEITLPASLEHIGRFAFLGTKDINLYFAGESLPLYCDEDWNHGIADYYLGVTNVTTSGDWKYATLTSGGVAILDYTGNATAIDLNALDFGGKIVNIGSVAFAYSAVESIILPEGLKTIQTGVFQGSALKEIVIPASVQFIGKEAFANTKITSLTFAENSKLTVIEQSAFEDTKELTSVTIPASLITMGRAIFKNSGITSLTFEDGSLLTEIADEAFAYTKIQSLVLPDSIVRIGNGAFRDTASLASVTFGKADFEVMSNAFYRSGIVELDIPANMTYIGEYAFVALSNLKDFTVDGANPYYTAVDGLLVGQNGRKLIAVPAGREGSMTLPLAIEVIGFGAFEESKLSEIKFHEDANILSLGYRSFFGAKNIKEITIPESVVAIDYYAFAYCTSLERVVFAEGSGLNGVYEGAFYRCNKLSEITLPDGIDEISDFAFYGCSALKQIPVGENSEVKGIYSYAMAYSGLSGELTLPETLIDIGEYAFLGIKATKITIPDTNAWDLVIGIGAFEECNKLEEITLPFVGASFEDQTITWLGYVFGAGDYTVNELYIPDSLKKVIISEGTETLYPNSFYGITKVDELVLPYSITTLYSNVWGYTYMGPFTASNVKYELLNTIDFVLSTYGTISHQAVPDHIGQGLFGHLKISDSTTQLGWNTFQNCQSLTSLTLSDSIISIHSDFSRCTSLESVYITDITAWCNIAFESSLSNPLYFGANLYLNGELITNLIIPSDVTSIGEYAFFGCTSLTSINLSDSVTSIGGSAFHGCTSLKSVTIPDGVTNIGHSAFQYCSSLTSINIPNGVTSIGKYAFSDCSNLTSITIPDGVTSIGERTFWFCRSLTSITIPDSVTSIGDSAFSWCSLLSLVYIGKGVTDIAPDAFSSCSLLYYIDNRSNLPLTIGSNDYGNLAKNAKIIRNADRSLYWSDTTIEYGLTNDEFLYTVKDDIYTLVAYVGGKETITLPATINGNDYTINRLRGVRNVIIPNNITSIDAQAFYGSPLTNITIPASVTSIGIQAFSNCSALISMDFSANPYFSYADGMIYNKEKTKIIGYTKLETDIVIPNSVTSIGDRVFQDCYNLTSITLPDGLTSIGNYAFYGCSSLASITLPDGLTSIGSSAFLNCYVLKSVTLPDSVTSIGSSAFGNCHDIRSITIPDGVTSIAHGVFSGCYALRSVTLPDGITSIGSSAFANCYILSNITIPHSVTSIGYHAFLNCRFTSITIGNSVTSIDTAAFFGCYSLKEIINYSNLYFYFGSTQHGEIARYAETIIEADGTIRTLKNTLIYDDIWLVSQQNNGYRLIGYRGEETSITLPDTVFGSTYTIAFQAELLCGVTNIILPNTTTNIGSSAFKNCNSLTTITIPDGVQWIGDYAFSGCTSLTSITISDSVTYIGDFAFEGCTSLISITIPDSVTSIGEATFSGCTSLTSITIPDSVTSIGEATFSGCTTLTSITIPDGVISIGTAAFRDCTSLTSINIPDSVTSICDYAFSGCTALQKVYITDLAAWCNITLVESYYTSRYDPGRIDFNPLHNGAILYINGTPATSIILPEGITSIGDSFRGYRSLISITIPDGVTTIEPYTFKGCNSLANITIPDGVTSIGDYAFCDCSSLTSITVPNGVTSIGNYAFCDCYNLTSVTLSDDLTSIGDCAFIHCQNMTCITVPNNVTSIGSSAFAQCYTLTAAVIGNGVTNIGANAFNYCYNLTSVTLGKNVIAIGSSAFSGCYKLYYINNRSTLNLSLASHNYGEIGYYAKMIENANEITIEDDSLFLTDDEFLFTVKDGHYQLIAYVGSKETVTLPLNVNGSTYEIYQMRGVNHVIIPEGITSISDYAFCDFTSFGSLRSITIPNSVTNIGMYAFYNCSSLTSIIIPDSVTSIGYSAFNECTALKNVFISDIVAWCNISRSCNPLSYGANLYINGELITNLVIPDGVTSIGDGAFSGCTTLTSITLPDGLTSIGSSAFSGCTNLTSITIPDGVTSIGDYAFCDCTNLTSITIPDGVTSIGDGAFSGCTTLTSITIPNSVTNIGQYAFFNTAMYHDSAYWNNGVFYIDNCLIEVSADTVYFDWLPNTRLLANGAYANCPKLKQAYVISDFKDELSNLTNLETLVILDMPKHYVYNYFGSSVPLTIKNVVIAKGANILLSNRTPFYDMTGITIYVEDTEKDTMWDENFPGWRNDNHVVYGDKWIFVNFSDVNGAPFYSNIFQTSQVIRVPYYDIPTDGQYTYELVGWDLDGDGVADPIPATSTVDIHAYPVFKKQIQKYTVTFYGKNGEDILYQYSLPYGSAMPIVVDPFKQGYTFLGWVGYDSSAIVTSDIAIYSEWLHEGNGHEYGTPIWYEPTCTEEGYNKHTCLVCGEWYGSDYVPASGHSYETKTVNPTCVEDGYTLHQCHCGDSYRDDVVPKIEHRFGDILVDKDATCTEEGSEYRACIACGHKEYTTIQPKGHSYTVETLHKATCQTHGLDRYTCITCGFAATEETDYAPHNYERKFASKWWLQRLIEGVLNIVFGYEGDQMYYYECTDCGRFRTAEGAILNNTAVAVQSSKCVHDLSDWHVYIDATCTEYGVEARTCTRCQKIIEVRSGEEPHHQMSAVDGKAPTCTEIGWEAHEACTKCDYSTRVAIPALGHTDGEWIVGVEPTCTEEGAKHLVCAVCGETIDNTVIEKLPHEYDSVVIAPTCTEMGYTTYICHCGDTYVDDYVDATGHTDGEWIVDIEPTCTEEGAKHLVCAVCGETIDNAMMEKLPHAYGSVVTAPTCTGQGYTTYTCHCGDSYVADYVSATGHTDGEWIVDIEPTCTEEGAKHLVCAVCGETIDNAVIGKILHAYGFVVTAPTCTEKGYTTYTCHCGDSYVDDYVSATGHTEVVDEGFEATCTETGFTEGKHCLVCNEVLVKQNVVNVLDHSFTDYKTNNDATYTENGTETAKCDRCAVTDTRTDENSALGLDQKFKDEMAALSKDATTETVYAELYSVLQTYATLSDAEKANVATEYAALQQLVAEYNAKVQVANTELADATEVALAPIVATGFTFLAALWFLLKKKFFI